MNSNLKRALPWYLLALVIIVLDQITKALALSHLEYARPVEVIDSFFNLTLVYNYGAAFSFLSDAGGWQRWFFTVLAVAVSVVLVVWLSRLQRHERLLSVALALVLGGAVGNLYDRVTLGYVVDFIDLYWGQHHFPAFNIADAGISIGAVLLIWESLFTGKPNAAGNNDSNGERINE